MISIRSSADMARAMAGPLDPDLRRLLMLRRDQLLRDTDADLGEYVHFIVVRTGDTIATVQAEAGVPVGTDNHYEWIERHGAWLEAVTITDDDGFAVVLLVPDRIGIDTALLFPLLANA